MTDPISNVGRSAAQLNNVNEKAKAPKADDLATQKTEKPVQSNCSVGQTQVAQMSIRWMSPISPIHVVEHVLRLLC